MVAGSCWRGNLGCENLCITPTMGPGFVVLCLKTRNHVFSGANHLRQHNWQNIEAVRFVLCVCGREVAPIRPQCHFDTACGAAYFGNSS